MTCRIWSTFGTSNPPKTTIIQETTVISSTIQNNVERVNEVFNSIHVEDWPGCSVIRAATPPSVEPDSSSKPRKRKCSEGLEDGGVPQKLKSWTPNLDASTLPETVYHLEYRRADGSLAERIVKAEPFAESGSTNLLPKLKVKAKETDGTNRTTNPGTQQLCINWSLDEETWVMMKSLKPHPFANADRKCELQANYKILYEATRQLEKMLSGTDDTKIIASNILSRLDFVEITLLSCTTVVGQSFSDRQTSGNWTKEEQKAFRRKFDDAVHLSWTLNDILGGWEQLLELLVHEVDIWRPEACCKIVSGAGPHDSTYAELLADLDHRCLHRICEATRMEMNDRSRCVIKWDLVDLRVKVLCC
ncbi:hypothetical protein WAI453_012668 [Rhynchosporium graminicola]